MKAPLGLALGFIESCNLNKGAEMALLILMNMHTETEKEMISTSIEMLAKLSGCSSRSVNRHLNELTSKNVIIRKNNRAEQLIMRNEYKVIGWKSFIEKHSPKE